MATRKANILCKKTDKRKAIAKDKANKRAKGDDDDVIIIEDPASTVVLDDDDDDDGYAPLALPLLPPKTAAKPPPKRITTTKTSPKVTGNKKLIVVPVSALGNAKITAKKVLSSNILKSALTSLSNKSPPANKTSNVNFGNLKATPKPSETSKSANKIVPEVDNKIKVKLGPEVSIVTRSPRPTAPSGDHDYFSANSTPVKKPNSPLTIIKSPLKNNMSALNSVKAPPTVNITQPKMPTKDILNSYPIPDNLKIDLNSNKITIGNEVCTVNSFQYCGNQRMKVFVAATDKSPARTIVLRKMPEQNVKDMKNVATVFNPPKSPMKNPTINKVNVATPMTTPKTTPQTTRPQITTTSTTPGPLPTSKTPVFVIKPNQKEKRQKMLEEAKATRKLLDEISKAMDLDDKKSTKSYSSESSVLDPKEKHGRRWSELNKLHSVAIHQSCPKRYKLLTTIFAMPTKRSIVSSFRRIKVTAGVNSQLLYLFHSMTSSLLKNEQLYAVIFDIVTFTLKNKVPEYCLIFYLKSLTTGVEQVAGFWAQLQTFSAEKISTCIKEMVSACLNVGIFVCCIVGDSKYLRVLNQLGVTEKDPFFEINGRKVYAIFEPKNLLVSTRNTFFKHDIHIEDKKGEKLLASWRHIKDCVTFDRVNTYQQMPKIDDSVLECEKFDKAKFSNARKVLSYKMGSCINGYICSGYVDKSALGSATYIVKINQVFNSFFGKSSSGVNCALQKSKEDVHLKFWSSSYDEIKKWKYINNIKSFTPQCQKCLLINLKSLPLIWFSLKVNGVTTFNLDKLSTRPIEKFVVRLKKKLPKGKNVSIIPSLTKALQMSIDSTINQVVAKVNENKSKYETLTDFIDYLTSSETYDQFIQDIDVRVKHEMSSDESDDEK